MDVKLTTARAAELCKMDGALIVDRNIKRILYAAALLMPSSLVKTSETGARHQAAERTAKQTGQLVIAVSQRTGTVTLYFGEQKYIVKELQELLTRTRETLEILERNRRTFDDVMSALNFREISGTTKVRDFISVLQRAESIFRIEKKINEFLTELGVEGEFLGIQFKELMKDVEKTFDLVIKDYKGTSSGKIRKLLSELSNEQLLDSLMVIKILNYNFLDDKISAKGYRFLNKIPILNPQEINLLIKKLGFKKILEANAFDFTVFKQLNEKRVQIAEEIKRVKENLILKIKG